MYILYYLALAVVQVLSSQNRHYSWANHAGDSRLLRSARPLELRCDLEGFLGSNFPLVPNTAAVCM
jgi:hypothetical protein